MLRLIISVVFSVLATVGLAQTTSGDCSPVVSGSENVTVNCGAVESEYLLIPVEEGKKVPPNILEYVNVDTPVRRSERILGTPFRSYDGTFGLFGETEIDGEVDIFRFRDLDMMTVTGKKNEIISVTIQKNFEESGNFTVPPFQHTSIGKVTLGESTIGNLLGNCSQGKMNFFRFSRDAFFAAECYFGNLGDYRYYVFGCYCFAVDGGEIVDGKLLDLNGNELPVLDQPIDFVSISAEPGTGSHIDYQLYR